MNLSYPLCIDREFTDWYRNYALKGQNNSHLEVGFNIKWSYGVFSEIRSYGVGITVRNHWIQIL